MSYLKFDRYLMANLGESLPREYIRTNRKGAYCCSSIVGCNTRKYHGVLVVPLPEISQNNHVLLSSLDLSIVQHEVPFNVAVHEYEGGVYSPKGYKYIREYNVDVSSSTTYRVGGVVLQKEFYFCHYEHRVIIRFTMLEGHSRTTLQLRPFLAFRDVKMLTHKNDHINTDYVEVAQGVGFSLYPGYPVMYMQLSKENRFVDEPYWNEHLAYYKEKERGYEYTEDLYVPGYFEVDIKQGESIYFSASLDEVSPDSLAEEFDYERSIRIPREDFRSCLLNAAQQFYYRPNKTDGYILAGYPWFGVRARDLMISLPGCSFYAGAPERFERVMDTFIPALDDYISQRSIDRLIQRLNEPDVGLWAVWAMQQYLKWTKEDVLPERFIDFVERIIQYYRRNIHPNTRVEDNGLLYAEGDGSPLTWMDAKIAGQAVIPRSGYLVELNALWFNALSFLKAMRPSSWGEDKEALLQKVKDSYTTIFVNEYGYLFDYVTHQGYRDWSVRPNMLFAISLDYSPLARGVQRSVLDIITRELLTPKGIRSLSPKSEGYKAYCSGSQYDREHSYYNGSAWPWLLGSYIEAQLKLQGRSAISFIERMLIGMEEELQEHGVGTISELFDGNPPFRGRGAISFAMSVGELLRSLYLLEEEKEKYNYINPIIRYDL